jgi:hypothetical protein
MTYTEQGYRVTLELTRADFEQLTLLMGCALGAAMRDGNKATFYAWLAFANALNATNPRWTPFEIPPEYQPGKVL